jgi:hypothetical protein
MTSIDEYAKIARTSPSRLARFSAYCALAGWTIMYFLMLLIFLFFAAVIIGAYVH